MDIKYGGFDILFKSIWWGHPEGSVGKGICCKSNDLNLISELTCKKGKTSSYHRQSIHTHTHTVTQINTSKICNVFDK